MHRNARLTPQGRLLLCQRIEGGWPVAHAAAAMGISRDLRLVAPLSEEGPAGLEDRSSRPKRCPTRTKASIERRVVTLRQKRGLGRRASPASAACRRRRCTGCWCATG